MYTISEITTFDEEKQLFETHIGLTPADFKIERTPNCIAYDDVEMVLLLSAWGKSKKESIQLAKGIVERMNLLFEDPKDLKSKSKHSHPDLSQPHEAVKR